MRYRAEPESRDAATVRADRWADVEEMVRCMKELGWRIERLAQVDEDGEPLRVHLRFCFEPESMMEML